MSPSSLGADLGARLQMIATQQKGGNKATHRITFQGNLVDLPIYRVPISMPKYRLANGRTVSQQAEYLAVNPAFGDNFFSKDPEILDVQRSQHEILLKMTKDQGLAAKFTKPGEYQVDPILLDEKGFVVNGNRRLALWRDLLEKDSALFGHFSHIDICVLPPATNEDIDQLEASLQIEEDVKADYTWDALANMYIHKMNAYGLSAGQVAKRHKIREDDVLELIDMQRYADEYLKSRAKADRWSLVSDNEFAFKQIVVNRKKLARDGYTTGEQELFKHAAFALIDQGAANGRLYEQIKQIAEFMPHIKVRLAAGIPMPISPDIGALPASHPGSADDADIFGTPEEADTVVALAREVANPGHAPLVKIIVSGVIEEQKALARETKNAGYLLKKIADANSDLSAGIADGLKPDSITTGVDAQLSEIEAKVADIRVWLLAHTTQDKAREA